MSTIFVVLLFFLIPTAAEVFFIVSLVRFIIARTAYARSPESYDRRVLDHRKTLMIVSAVIMGVLLVVVVAVILLFFQALTYM